MKKILGLILVLLFSISCSNSSEKSSNDKIKVVTTISYFKNLIEEIGKEKVEVDNLMKVGEDPHMYIAKPNDYTKLDEADLVVYGGLHLEGKMTEIFEKLSSKNTNVVNLSNAIDKNELIKVDDNTYDPHVWFNSKFWLLEAQSVRDKLIELDSKNKEYYTKNYQEYEKEILEMKKYIQEKINEIPESNRILVTAHDAFSYFAKEYGLHVESIQGVSTDSETSIKAISELAKYISDNGVKSIFLESSVSPKSIEALKEAVKSYGGEVEIGEELYSDSMGEENGPHNTYIKTLKYNADIISESLK